MKVIRVASGQSAAERQSLCKIWCNSRNATLEISKSLTTWELASLYADWKSILPNDLALCVIGNLVERDEFPIELLEEAYNAGDTECRIAICLKPNLPEKLRQICLSSNNPDVIAHIAFRDDVTLEECVTLLQQAHDNGTIAAIERAMEQKRNMEKP